MDAKMLSQLIEGYERCNPPFLPPVVLVALTEYRDLLAAVEGSQDEIVRELLAAGVYINNDGERFPIIRDTAIDEAAAALVAELAAKEKADAEVKRLIAANEHWHIRVTQEKSLREQAEAERDEAMRVLKLANDSCRSAYQIAARKGSETEWETWQFALQKSLNEQHRFMFPEQYSEDRRIRAHDRAAHPKEGA